MQCRKQALLRVRKDFVKEQKEMKRQQALTGHSDGLKNISKNLLGEEFDVEEKKAVDWVPPTTFGLDNSVRLIDAVKEINASAVSENGMAGEGRILTSKQDIKNLTPDQLRHKINSVLKKDDSDSDSDSSVDGGDNDDNLDNIDDDEDITYKLGVTSGSKLVDK